MSYKDLEYQKELIVKYLAKAEQCFEYKKLDDGSFYLAIAEILSNGFKAAKPSYEEESLINLAQALA